MVLSRIRDTDSERVKQLSEHMFFCIIYRCVQFHYKL